MKNIYPSLDTFVYIDRNTDCRIGIGKDYDSDEDDGMQIRYANGRIKKIPFFLFPTLCSEEGENIVFSNGGNSLVKAISFSNKEMFDNFRHSEASHRYPIILNQLLNASVRENVEFVPEADEWGSLTSGLVEQRVAHEENIDHISVYFLAVNLTVFKNQGDIGIYIPRNFAHGYYVQNRCPWALGGGDILINTNPYRIDMGDNSDDALLEWENCEQGKLNPELRNYLSVQEVVGRIKDETGIILSGIKSYPKISESGEVNFDSLVPKYPSLHCIEYNLPYVTLDQQERDGRIQEIKQNERFDIYVFEHNGDIAKPDHSTIESIDLLPSKKILCLLETNPEFFGAKNVVAWKVSPEYLIIKRVVEKITNLKKPNY